MRRKLFLSYVIIILAAVGILSISFWEQGYQYLYKQSQDNYLSQTKLIADLFEQSDLMNISDYQAFSEQYANEYNIRITIIEADGDVVADSEAEELENHASREEVAKALLGESNSTIRYSSTMKQKYSYSAVPVQSGEFSGVVRVSVPLSQLKAFDSSIARTVGLALVICFIVALGIAYVLMRVLTRPIIDVSRAAENISNGDYGIKIYTREKFEVGRLANSFNTMSKNLSVTMHTLTQRNIELEAMLGSMSSGVVAIDGNYSILFYNDAFKKLFELDNKEIKGKSIYSVLRNAVIFEVVDSIRERKESQVLEGGLNVSCEKSIRVMATPLRDENESSLGTLIIVEDITQMKHLETVRSDFVSNVTHELKTPLTSIRGFIDTLKHGAIQDEKVALRFLDIIDIEAERLYLLIQDILLLSEIESKKETKEEFCDVNTCILDVVELLKPKLSSAVEIIYDENSKVTPYYCNPDRLKQLLINLTDNAIKYTEKGSISISAKEENQSLVLSIQDTGIGMEEEHLSRIFERFYRVDKGRSRNQGGTGLGLSIVKHIVELFGGSIHVTSNVDVGTCFKVYLPYQNNEVI